MKKTMAPKLRFPEFREAEGWVDTQLIELGQPISGLSGKSGTDFGMGKLYVTYKQVFDCAWIDFAQCGRVKIEDNENQNELHQGDILFTTSSETPAEVGFASVILATPPEPIYLNSFCFAFRPYNLDTLKPQFSQFLFHSPIYRKSIKVLAQGSTRFNISKGAFLNLKLPIPKDEIEQQKIAATLSSLDELIAAQSEKIKALQAHKKGLMQRLFPAEGETVPRVRFGEFEGSGAWEEKKMHEITLSSAFGPRFSSEHYSTNGNVATLRTTDMDTEGNLFLEGMPLALLRSDAFKSHFLQKGDLLITRSGTIGVTALFLGYRLPVIPGAFLIRFRLNQKLVQPKIIFYYFNSKNGKHKLTSLAAGGVQKNLTGTSVLEISLHLPTLTEQQKIVACLSSLDDLIAAQSEKLEALKAHKKGLMQQLFPNQNEKEA